MSDDVAELAWLAQTVAARLCHDLSGLAGTLINTLELAEEEGGEALEVAAQAGRALGGRLRLLRAAWGGSGGPRDPALLAELMSHAAGFPRTRTDWSGCGAGPLAPAVARVLLNVALVGVESLPRGGVVRLSVTDGTAAAVLEGPGLERPGLERPGLERPGLERQGAAWPAALTAPLTGRAEAAEPRQVQVRLAALFAGADGVRLAWDPAAPDVLVLRA